MSTNTHRGTVIMTGASGFVGRNLARSLEGLGYHVIPVSLRTPEWRAQIPLNALAFIHLAGIAHDLKGHARQEDYFRVNTGLSQDAFDAFDRSGARKFIFVSSVKAVIDDPGESVVTEEVVPAPATPYGQSKFAAERHILTAAQGREGVYILRPCMIHGPGNKGNLNLLYRWVVSGVPYPFGAFANLRSFLSIDNLNFVVHELCARSDIESGVYHVSDRTPLSTKDVVALIATSAGKKARIWHISPRIIRTFATVGDALRLPFGTMRLQKLTGSYQVSNDKLLQALGKELPLSAREGLIKTLQAFSLKSPDQAT